MTVSSLLKVPSCVKESKIAYLEFDCKSTKPCRTPPFVKGFVEGPGSKMPAAL